MEDMTLGERVAELEVLIDEMAIGCVKALDRIEKIESDFATLAGVIARGLLNQQRQPDWDL